MSSRFKKAKDIIGRFRSKLDTLFADSHSLIGELLTKALHYLHIYWKPLFAYLNDGSYSIDNLIVEYFIRSLAGERKNFLFLGTNRIA
ncbi:IS66 family transposase [Bacteroides thetaiotaomicron]|uniref:IS66 family transposase n=1 Tax=Bacteroides thetaiotaomicron TaxID=818 RepID=UPI0015FE5A8F|nr:transposase [Bacteroides thetaiotaomicron]